MKDHAKSISSQIFEALREDVLSGKYPPGDKLPTEKELCELYAVSRSTVRAALQQLRGFGLIETQRGGRSYVVEHSTQNAMTNVLSYVALNEFDRMNIYEFRSLMEIQSVGLAAQRASTHDVDDMKLSILKMREATSTADMAQYDLDFHGIIARATCNEYILKVFDVMRSTYYTYLRQNTETLGTYGVQLHELICQAIEVRDSERAKRLMEEHLRKTVELASFSDLTQN